MLELLDGRKLKLTSIPQSPSQKATDPRTKKPVHTKIIPDTEIPNHFRRRRFRSLL